MDQSRFWSAYRPEYSLEDLPEFDPDAEVSSPRSVQACEMEGVLPGELVYTPYEEFDLPGVDPTIVQMRYDFHEARRQDLLAVVRHRRQVMMGSLDGSAKLVSPASGSTSVLGATVGSPTSGVKPITSPMPKPKPKIGLIAPGSDEPNPHEIYAYPGAPPSIAPFIHIYDYFSYWHKELDPLKEMPKEKTEGESPTDGSRRESLGGSPDLSKSQPQMQKHRPDSGSAGSAAYNLENPGGKAGSQASLLGSHNNSTMTMPPDEKLLQNIQLLRTCSGRDRPEVDCAKNTENNLVVLRQNKDKARAVSQHTDRRIVKRRNDMQDHCFERLLDTTLQNREATQHRMEFARPAHIPRKLQVEARHQMVFEKNANDMKAMVDRRQEYSGKTLDADHARMERIASEHNIKSLNIANNSMAARVRWRENHHKNVTIKLQEFEEEKIRMFAQKEAELKKRQAVSDNRGFLRKELNKLRNINRKMNEEMRQRKGVYETEKKDKQLAAWKQSINAAALSLVPPKMKSNLESSFVVSPASLDRSISAGSLAMSRPVPTHLASPLANSGSGARLYSSWYRHG